MWNQDALNDVAEFYADNDNTQFIGGPCDREEAWRRIAYHVGHWAIRGFGTFMLIEKKSGAFVGYCGPYYPEGWPEHELGWALVRRFQGQGLASEAARKAREFAFSDLRWTTAVSYIRPDNLPSQRLAARIGAQLEGTIIFRGKDAGVWRHPQPSRQIN
jgi:RimJ/RimL family protein N-acetyltransferase